MELFCISRICLGEIERYVVFTFVRDDQSLGEASVFLIGDEIIMII